MRTFWLAAMGFNACVVAYVYMTMNKLFRLDHAEVVWYRVIHLGQIFYDPLMYVPLLTGAFLAAAQFFPEMKSHRFRIALHLPLPPHQIVLGHIFVGLSAVLVILLADLAALGAMTSLRFPMEIALRALTTATPWALTGLTAYLGTTLLLLEPTWRLRVYNFVVTAGLCALFLQNGVPGAYERILPLLFGLVALFTPSVLLPAYRFRYRRV